MDDIQELVEEVLWDEVSEYVEQVKEFKKMISDIGYIDHAKADEVTWCEVFDTEEIIVTKYSEDEENDEIRIEFEMPFLLSAWKTKSKEQLFRVTAYAKGKAVIDTDEEEVKKIYSVKYTDVEVDSVYL